MLRRFYSISAIVFSFKKQGIKLCKMLDPKPKRQWYNSPMEGDLLPTLKTLTKIKREPGKRGIRRMSMLNKLFMKHITDLMSTGSVSMDIVGRGIEISKVTVTPDFHTVNVFWVSKGNASDAENEAVLSRTAGALRHELSTLRVMGEVPYIVFVKDKLEARIIDLDRRLAVADYGEDYTPTDLGHLLKSEFSLHTKLSPEMKAKIKQLEDETPIHDVPIPEMTNDVYGLDHDKIMSRLLASRKKSIDAWTNFREGNNVISYQRTSEDVPGIDFKQQKKELTEFLLQRKILQNKMFKEINSPDVILDTNDEDYHSDEDIYDEEDDYFEAEEDYYDSDESLQAKENKENKI